MSCSPLAREVNKSYYAPWSDEHLSRTAIAIDNDDLDSGACRKGWTGLPRCGVGVFEMSTGDDPRRVLVVEA